MKNLVSVLAVLDSPFSDETFIKKLFPNVWDFLIQFGGFIILVLVVFFLGYKPVKKLLNARKEYVEGNLRGSEDAKKEAIENARLSKEHIENSKLEAKKIIEEAKQEASLSANKILDEAKENAKLLKEKTSKEIEESKIAAKEDIQNEIVDVALEASKEILKREVNEKDNQKLVKDFVKQLGEEDK